MCAAHATPAEGRSRPNYPYGKAIQPFKCLIKHHLIAEIAGRCGSWPFRRHSRSKTEFAVRAEAHEIEMPGVGLAVDQNHVGPDVAVPMVLPLTGKRMVAMARRERPILRQVGQNTCKVGIKGFGEAAFLLAPVIPLEDRGSPNRPH